MTLKDQARALARGSRQAALIEELLSGPNVPVYGVNPTPSVHTALVGEARLPWKSWQGLRKRLKDAGFRVQPNRNPPSLTLWPPVSPYAEPCVLPGVRVFEASWLPRLSQTHFLIKDEGKLERVVEHTAVEDGRMWVSPALGSALQDEQDQLL